jgi:hypothetical protein
MSTEKKDELFNEFDIDGADPSFLKSLKKTINSEASSENGELNDSQIKDSKENNIILLINEETKNKELIIDNLPTNKDDEIIIDDNESVSNSVIEEPQKKKRAYKPRKK